IVESGFFSLTRKRPDRTLCRCHASAEAGISGAVGSLKPLQRTFHNLLHWPKPPEPFIATREESLVGPDKFHAARFQRVYVLLRGGMEPHLAVHGRSDEQLCLRIQRQGNARQSVI